MSLWLFEHRFVSDPHEAVELQDTNETWSDLLSEPEVVSDEDHGHFGTKFTASVLCGARYFDSATTRDKENVDAVECLVLDVDNADTNVGHVPGEFALRSSLQGLRAVVYTSPSHRDA